MGDKLENNYATEVLSLEWKFWALHQDYQPGVLVTEGGAPRESVFEDHQGLIIEFHRIGENRHTILWVHAPGPLDKKQWPHKRQGQIYLILLLSSAEAGDAWGSLW